MKNGIKKATAFFTTVVLLTLIILVNTGESVKANCCGSVLVSIYGTRDLSYAEYYAGELGKTATELDVDTLYSGTKSVVVGNKLDTIPSILNYTVNKTETGESYNINGIKQVDVAVQKELFAKLSISDKDTEENRKAIIKKLKDDYKIDVTYLVFDDQKKNAEGVKVDSIPVATVKPLKEDGSFGKSETVKFNSAKDFSKPVDGFAPNGYVASYYNKFGDVLLYLDYTEDYKVFDGWSEYKNNIYAVNLTNEKTGEVYGLLWANDVWSLEKSGAYLSLALNFNDLNKRFKDFKIPGEYTLSVLAKGYKTVEAKNIKINIGVKTKPKLTTKSVAESATNTPVVFDYTDVDQTYVNSLANAKYTLKSGNNDVSTNLGTYDPSTKSITINNSAELVKKYGAGYYSLSAEVENYQTLSYSVLITSDLAKPLLKIGNKIYNSNETIKAVKGEPIYIVDKDGNFISGFGNSRKVWINGVQVFSKVGCKCCAPSPAIKYNPDEKTTILDTSIEEYKGIGEYEVLIKVPGYNDFTYKIQIVRSAAEELEFVAQKTNAKNSLDTYKNASDYRETQKTELLAAINSGKTAIDRAEVISEIEAASAKAKTTIDVIKTDAQYTAEELVVIKTNAKNSLDIYKNANDYREAQKTDLAVGISNGKIAIDKAITKEQVETELTKSKSAIDAIKTDAKLKTEELENIKTTAKNNLDNYKIPSIYREAEQKELASAKVNGKVAIDKAQTNIEIDTALSSAKAVIDLIKVNSQITAEELEVVKTNVKKSIDEIKNPNDYRETQRLELVAIINSTKIAIDKATIISEIETVFNNAKTTIGAIKTDAQYIAEELVVQKTNAKNSLDIYTNASDYREAQKTELAEVISNEKIAIDKAITKEAVETELTKSKSAIDAIKTDAKLKTEELENIKTTAKNSLDNYKIPSIYREAGQKELASAKDNGKVAIDKATTKAEAETVLNSAKASIDAIKTDAQFTAEEVEAQKVATQKAAEVEAQKVAAQKAAELEAQKVAAQKAAELEAQKVAAQKAAELEAQKVATQKAAEELEAQKVAAQKAVEELAAQKLATKNSLDTYKNVSDYREAQKADLAAAISNGKIAIDKAITKEEVETELTKSKSAIDAIKTDAQITAEELAAQKNKDSQQKPAYQDDGSKVTNTGESSTLPIVASFIISFVIATSLKVKKEI